MFFSPRPPQLQFAQSVRSLTRTRTTFSSPLPALSSAPSQTLRLSLLRLLADVKMVSFTLFVAPSHLHQSRPTSLLPVSSSGSAYISCIVLLAMRLLRVCAKSLLNTLISRHHLLQKMCSCLPPARLVLLEMPRVAFAHRKLPYVQQPLDTGYISTHPALFALPQLRASHGFLLESTMRRDGTLLHCSSMPPWVQYPLRCALFSSSSPTQIYVHKHSR